MNTYPKYFPNVAIPTTGIKVLPKTHDQTQLMHVLLTGVIVQRNVMNKDVVIHVPVHKVGLQAIMEWAKMDVGETTSIRLGPHDAMHAFKITAIARLHVRNLDLVTPVNAQQT